MMRGFMILLAATFPLAALADESPSLEVNYVGSTKDDRVTYSYTVNGGNPELRYWLVVETRTSENWLQGGGDFGEILKNGVRQKFVIGANDLTFPARIYVAGFETEKFEELVSQTKEDGDWFLSDPSEIEDTSYACTTDANGKIVKCGKP